MADFPSNAMINLLVEHFFRGNAQATGTVWAGMARANFTEVGTPGVALYERKLLTFSAAVNGTTANTNTVSIPLPNNIVINTVLRYVSLHNHATAGVVLGYSKLAIPITVQPGWIHRITTGSVTFTP